jgi:S-formylglutathione hydrolase
VQCPWGRKAFSAYLGTDRTAWANYDACELVARKPLDMTILIDQGAGDEWLQDQLQPQLFEKACAGAGQSLELRMQPEYDHGFYFISSFIGDHLAYHARALNAA